MAAETPGVAVRVHGLRRSYGSLEALRGIDLDVGCGEIVALLGPNGAGKTTTVEILEGYRTRDAGEVSVLGVDPADGGSEWRGRIGIVLQTCAPEPDLSVRESLELYAGYAESPLPVEEVLRMAGLEDNADQRVGKLSGGQQRRLDVGLGLVGDPELLFLDEPTTGFDPAARHAFWHVIRQLRTLGKTVLLTTHYMDEAQALADRVVVIDNGRVIAEGRPEELAAREATRIRFQLPDRFDAAELPTLLDGAKELPSGFIELRTDAPVQVLRALTEWADERQLDLPGLEVARPSLEEIYLELTEAKTP